MKIDNLQGKITISRPSFGDGRELICIRVKDVLSVNSFLELSMSYDDFTRAITGVSEVPVDFKVKDVDVIGKKKISELRRARMEGGRMSKEATERWLLDNFQEEGWIIDTYVGSQNSFVYDPSEICYWINYRVYKYVFPEKGDLDGRD